MNFRSAMAGLIASLFCGTLVAAWQDQPTDPAPQDSPPVNASGNAAPAGAAAETQPLMPAGFPLDQATQAYIEELLKFWEGTSDQVTHYQCAFTRWMYDPELCNFRKPENNHLVAAEISRGNIRYRKPDSGMYEVDEKWNFNGPPTEPGGEPEYVRRILQNAKYPEKEKWICDGESIYEYDYETKYLYETKLPPEAQGEGLKNSPLPFVFGAKAIELLDRFWIRDITPANVENQYWLEAWPKQASDARNYSKIEIILSREPFLPVAVHMYAPNYDKKTNPSKMVFEFSERQINGTLAGLLDPFFIRPSTPFGWKRVERDLVAEAETARVGQTPGQPDNSR